MTASWAASIAFAVVLAVPALNGCDEESYPTTPPRPKTLDVDTPDGRVTLRGIARSEQRFSSAVAVNPASVVDPCADVDGLARKLCQADMKIEAMRGRHVQRQAGRQAKRPDLLRETVVWTPDASPAALRPRD